MKEKPQFVATMHLGSKIAAALMKRGNDVRDASGHPEDPKAPNEVMAVMFVLVEQTPGAFTLRLITNNEVISAIRSQGAIEAFLQNLDQLYADFRSQFPSS